jgi:hypothetical protein
LKSFDASGFVRMSHFGSITIRLLAIAIDGNDVPQSVKRFQEERRERKNKWPAICPRGSWNIYVKANI